MTIEARDRDGAPLTGLALVGQARAPDRQARRSRRSRSASASAGRYSGEASDVAAGIWDLEVEADRGGERLFRSKNRITLD